MQRKMEPADENNVKSCIESRHRKEKKELQSQIQALKKAAKNDKTKKKQLLIEITKLEIEMDSRHKDELELTESDFIDETGVINTVEHEFTNLKISKAQKRREKKSNQEKEREGQIKLQELENLHGPRNKEIKEIASKLKEKNLKIFQIPSDGDCLYKAIAHQMLVTREKVLSAEQLRKQVASYIKEYKHDFLPFMINPDTLDMLTDDEFDVYCDKISNTNMWGGQLEIRALSNALKCPIHIVQASGPDSIEQGSEFKGPPLIISYHRHMFQLGEHYNSTCLNEDIEIDY